MEKGKNIHIYINLDALHMLLLKNFIGVKLLWMERIFSERGKQIGENISCQNSVTGGLVFRPFAVFKRNKSYYLQYKGFIKYVVSPLFVR